MRVRYNVKEKNGSANYKSFKTTAVQLQSLITVYEISCRG